MDTLLISVNAHMTLQIRFAVAIKLSSAYMACDCGICLGPYFTSHWL